MVMVTQCGAVQQGCRSPKGRQGLACAPLFRLPSVVGSREACLPCEAGGNDLVGTLLVKEEFT
jgi:hypothetical protein